MAERPTSSVFDTAENVTALDTNTVTLWTASRSVSPMMEEYSSCSREGRIGAAQRQVEKLGGRHQVRPQGRVSRRLQRTHLSVRLSCQDEDGFGRTRAAKQSRVRKKKGVDLPPLVSTQELRDRYFQIDVSSLFLLSHTTHMFGSRADTKHQPGDHRH